MRFSRQGHDFIFTITPLHDAQAFADRINFGTVTSVEGRTIRATATQRECGRAPRHYAKCCRTRPGERARSAPDWPPKVPEASPDGRPSTPIERFTLGCHPQPEPESKHTPPPPPSQRGGSMNDVGAFQVSPPCEGGDSNPSWSGGRLTVVPCDRGADRVRGDGLDDPAAGAEDELKLVDEVEVGEIAQTTYRSSPSCPQYPIPASRLRIPPRPSP